MRFDRVYELLQDIDDMPLRWRIDLREKLFVAVADGRVEFQHVERMLDALVSSGAIGHRKLFDGLRGETRMTSSELLTLGVRMRAMHAVAARLGPVAVVVPHDKRLRLMRLLGILAAANRPLRIFNDLETAHRWLSLSAEVAEPA